MLIFSTQPLINALIRLYTIPFPLQLKKKQSKHIFLSSRICNQQFQHAITEAEVKSACILKTTEIRHWILFF